MSYEEYLRHVVELAQAILHPEENAGYPSTVKNSEARRAFYDYFDSDEELAVNIDSAIRSAMRPDWKKNFQKQRKIKQSIYESLLSSGYDEDEATIKTDAVFDIAGRQLEYDE